MKRIILALFIITSLNLSANAISLKSLNPFNLFKDMIKADLSLLKTNIKDLSVSMSSAIELITDIQNQMTANASAVMALESRIENTSVGGNQIITNDIKVIKESFDSYKAQANKFINFLYWIIGITFGFMTALITKYELQIRGINNRLFRMVEKDEAIEEKRMEVLFNKFFKGDVK